MRVQIDNPPQMNLLGLLLHGFLQQQLQQPKAARQARKLRGAFGIQAGSMAVTLCFEPGAIVIRKGVAERTRARVIGSLQEMVDLVTGGSILAAVIAVLEGRITVRGNVFALWSLLPLMTARAQPKALLPPDTGASP